MIISVKIKDSLSPFLQKEIKEYDEYFQDSSKLHEIKKLQIKLLKEQLSKDKEKYEVILDALDENDGENIAIQISIEQLIKSQPDDNEQQEIKQQQKIKIIEDNYLSQEDEPGYDHFFDQLEYFDGEDFDENLYFKRRYEDEYYDDFEEYIDEDNEFSDEDE